EIEQWGNRQHERMSKLLAWVTNNTNIQRLNKRIRPEGVAQLALRRRLQTARARSDQMDAAQLKGELERASRLAEEQAEWISAIEGENSQLESQMADVK